MFDDINFTDMKDYLQFCTFIIILIIIVVVVPRCHRHCRRHHLTHVKKPQVTAIALVTSTRSPARRMRPRSMNTTMRTSSPTSFSQQQKAHELFEQARERNSSVANYLCSKGRRKVWKVVTLDWEKTLSTSLKSNNKSRINYFFDHLFMIFS